MCVSGCWKVAKAGRGDDGSPTHVGSSANRVRPGWERFADDDAAALGNWALGTRLGGEGT
jgi:hypothetical protein